MRKILALLFALVLGEAPCLAQSGGGTGAGGSSGAMTQIVCNSPSGSGTTSFTSIPGTYTSLRIIGYGASSAAAALANGNVEFNSDTGTNYSYQSVYGTNNNTASAGGTFSVAPTGANEFHVPAQSGPPANSASSFTMDFPGYAQTTFNKMYLTRDGILDASALSGFFNFATTGVWASTAAISRIDLILSAGNWVSGSKICLYGIN